MACPDGKKTKKFVTAYLGDHALIRYTSKLPIVVYAPENIEVKYRIWKAEENVQSAEQRLGSRKKNRQPVTPLV